MPIRFPCACGKTLKVADDKVGASVTCPGCGRSITVPSPEELEQLAIAPLDEPEAEGGGESESPPPAAKALPARPVDAAEAGREARKALHRDRRRDADIKPGHVRLGADARKEAREGLRDMRQHARDSRRGTMRPGGGRPSRDALREANAEIDDADRRKRESARQVRGVPSAAARVPIPRVASTRASASAPAPAAVPAGPFQTPPYCPNCKAAAVPGARICTVCGMNFVSGEMVKSDLGIVKRIPWRSLVGPVLAVAVIAALYFYVLKPVLFKQKGPEAKPPAAPVAPAAQKPPAGGTAQKPPEGAGAQTQPPAQTPPVAAPEPYSAAAFKGGVIKGEVKLEDVTAPYNLDRAIIIDGGAKLLVGPGVRLQGKEITVAAGSLRVAGKDDSPVCLDVILNNRRGPAEEILAENCYFMRPATVGACKNFAAARCTFEKTLWIEPSGMSGVSKISCSVIECELKDPELSLKMGAGYSSDTLRMRVSRCNVFGTVEYAVELFAKAEMTDCFFPNGEKFTVRRKEGEFVEAPKATAKLQGVGAGTKASGATAATGGGSIWASETKPGDADRSVTVENDKLGFTVVHPGDWKTADAGETIRGPLGLASPTVAVQLAAGGTPADVAVEALVKDLSTKGALAIKSSNLAKSSHPAGESWERMVDYDIQGFRWRKKLKTIAAGGKTYVIVGTFRKDKEFEAGSVVSEIMASFNPK